jgi:hypothetical protein
MVHARVANVYCLVRLAEKTADADADVDLL